MSNAIVIAPCWATYPRYPTLLSMLIQHPVLLPRQHDLLTINETHLHPLRTTIVMAVWPVSGDSSQVQAFLHDQLSSSSIRGGQAPINSTSTFTRWCGSRSINPFQTTVSDVAEFLTCEFDIGQEL